MNSLHIGRAVADITGEPWGAGLMGYGMPDQWSKGILSRQYARAFVFSDGVERVVHVVADLGMFFQATVEAILEVLESRFGDLYTAKNVVLTATHTHCGPGGHGRHILYNITTKGFHGRTFDRVVDGVIAAISHAHDDVAEAEVALGRTGLHGASANRSQKAFDLNPEQDRQYFPDSVDPMSTVLSVRRAGELVGAINWFAVHNTSMTNRNRLISADNKGHAAYEWENEGTAPRTPDAGLVTAFAQTNAGDLSPNLDLMPGTGPTHDNRKNSRIIGLRQLDAAKQVAATSGETLTGPLDSRMMYVNWAMHPSADGSTGRAVLGASFAAGKLTDGPGSPLFDEGKNNPFLERISSWIYRFFEQTRRHHSPKDLAIPVGPLGWVSETYPVQLVRIGTLYLVCLPAEITIVAGLRIRRVVAELVDSDLDHVLVQGYANGYAHYVTTPEEYEFQNYEGGSTIFGRHELAVVTEAVGELAHTMATGTAVESGSPPPPQKISAPSPSGSPRWSRTQRATVLAAPTSTTAGWSICATFATNHPNDPIQSNYFFVEHRRSDRWVRIADDSSPSTEIEWSKDQNRRFHATVTWHSPVSTEPGLYRITYLDRTKSFPTEPIEVLKPNRTQTTKNLPPASVRGPS